METNNARPISPACEIRKYLDALWRPNEIRELRVFDDQGYISFGYFDMPEKMARIIARLPISYEIYTTLQPVSPALLARAANRIKKFRRGKDATTTDFDIEKINYVLVDIDPVRPAKISANTAELEKAKMIANKIIANLGQPAIFAFSGNGYHLIYRVELPIFSEQYATKRAYLKSSAEIIRGWLKGVNAKYADVDVDIDISVHNPARITKVIGTWARKGDNTTDRPHRQSAILAITSPHDQISIFPPPLPDKQIDKQKTNFTLQKNEFDVAAYLAEKGIVVKETKPWEGGEMHILEQCVFDPSHNRGEASVIRFASGVIIYKCQHNSCRDRTWKDLRESIEGVRKEYSRPCRDCGKTIIWEYGDRQPRDKETGKYHICKSREVKEKKGEKKESRAVKKRRVTTAEYLDFFISKKWDFRLNKLLDDVYIGKQRLDDIALSKVKASVRDWCIANNYIIDMQHATDAIATAASRKCFHPAQDYLDALPKWDGIDRIAQLVTYFQDDGNMQRWLEIWMAGAIYRVQTGHHHPMFCLSGPQGCGKSSFARWLCPIPDLYNDSGIHPDQKDCRLRLLSTWIWEVGELGSTTRRSDIDALKAFLSMEIVRERKAYGHFDIVKPAMASFIGTVNNDFLVDRTGNRRFLTTEIRGIDWEYQNKINKTQLWAQAAFANIQKKYELTDDEQKMRDYVNAENLIIDPVETLLERYYDFTNDPSDYVITADILSLLRGEGVQVTRGTAMIVAEHMKAGGAEKIRKRFAKKVERGFVGVKRIYNTDL